MSCILIKLPSWPLVPLSPVLEKVTTNYSIGYFLLPEIMCGIVQQPWHVTVTYCAWQ